jgi:hypothetical protein
MNQKPQHIASTEPTLPEKIIALVRKNSACMVPLEVTIGEVKALIETELVGNKLEGSGENNLGESSVSSGVEGHAPKAMDGMQQVPIGPTSGLRSECRISPAHELIKDKHLRMATAIFNYGFRLQGSNDSIKARLAMMLAAEFPVAPESSGESLGQREATEPLKADEKTDAIVARPSSPAPISESEVVTNDKREKVGEDRALGATIAESDEVPSSSTASPMTPGQALKTEALRTFHEETIPWEKLAQAAIDADPVRKKLEDALDESVELQSHYAHLLNMSDGGQRIVFANRWEWLERLAALAEAETKKEKA